MRREASARSWSTACRSTAGWCRWSGARAGEPRHQRLWFDTDADARAAYFARLESLAAEGFIDSASAMM